MKKLFAAASLLLMMSCGPSGVALSIPPPPSGYSPYAYVSKDTAVTVPNYYSWTQRDFLFLAIEQILDAFHRDYPQAYMSQVKTIIITDNPAIVDDTNSVIIITWVGGLDRNTGLCVPRLYHELAHALLFPKLNGDFNHTDPSWPSINQRDADLVAEILKQDRQ